MFKSFSARLHRLYRQLRDSSASFGGAGSWLQVVLGSLLLLNAAAVYFYFFPPGGSEQELTMRVSELKTRIRAAEMSSKQLETVAGKVQLASTQTGAFAGKYFLPRRIAYEQVVSEVQRLTHEAGIVEKEGTFAEEPIEGSSDLTLVTFSVSLEGTFADLMHFLYQVDHSPKLLILDSLSAAPVQNTGRLNLSLKLLTIIREPVFVPISTVSGARR
jgi:type IV pilus assembly protein PilO